MSEVQVRPTTGACIVITATEFYHLEGRNQGRQCHFCGSFWTVERDVNEDFHVWRGGVSEDSAILDWVGNNVSIECCCPKGNIQPTDEGRSGDSS